MKTIQVDGRELRAAEITVNSASVKVWPPSLARKVEARAKANRRQIYEWWKTERRQTGNE